MGGSGPVLAAVDLSEISTAVLRCAQRLANKLGAGLAVFHAAEELPAEDEEGLLLPGLRRRVDEARRSARSSLEAFLGEAGLRDKDLSAAIGPGPAPFSIVEHAGRVGAQLVVVGGPHPHLFPGSTAERVVRHCACPVLVVRRPPERGYRIALVGVDFSPGAARAWEAAVALAEADARMVACHVLEGTTDGEGDILAAGQLEHWVRGRAGGAGARVLVEHGSPRGTLVAAAEREGADLLAVGSHGRHGVAEALLGSVAERAVATSRCDVLVAGGGEP